jgi:RNA polymerase sigma factor (TIGR02999 family)
MNDVTQLLNAIEVGDPHAASQLLPLVYDALRRLAAEQKAREKPRQTLQATALVHEAYVRLVGADADRQWDGRGHFFAAAEAMRRILAGDAGRGRCPGQPRRDRGGPRRRASNTQAKEKALAREAETQAVLDFVEK